MLCDYPPDRDAITYVLPLRWTASGPMGDLTRYLHWLRQQVAVVMVVDGSPAEIFAQHANCWAHLVRHLPCDPDLDFANGKVNGVVTGLRRTATTYVVLADDDVRYDADSLRAVVALLRTADVVRPQNYFTALPWHARWDTARSLLNRCCGGDFPGTLGIRRDALPASGGYDGDVLFENLELVRTVVARGGREVQAPAVFVGRRPPTWRHFAGQRVRQAYDEFARPLRLVGWLGVLPVAGRLAVRRRALLAAGSLSSVLLAEMGRRRAGGQAVYPPTSALFAPLWVLERGTCSWLALGVRLCGGARYNGRRLKVAAHTTRELRLRQRGPGASGPRPAGPGL